MHEVGPAKRIFAHDSRCAPDLLNTCGGSVGKAVCKGVSGQMDNKVKQLISCVLIIAALGLIGLGVMNGGYKDVWNKARLICMECIGIG